ncbi:MAG: hypothetical protein DRJ57_02560 [Thermoprotei archaeon]|nr:MAG: hypothetical protein DRJ57_02560 [Thermoprotei archaeon]
MVSRSLERNLRLIYIRAFAASASIGMSAPFAGLYVAKLGASSLQLGMLHSLSNLASTVLQPIWGYLADRVRCKKYLVFAGGLTGSIALMLVTAVKDARWAIVLLTARALAASLTQPAWTALLGAILPPAMVGSVVARLNQWASVGSLAATLASGAASRALGVRGVGEFVIPLTLAGAAGVVAAVSVLPLREGEAAAERRPLREVARMVVSDAEYMRFVALSFGYGAFMSMAWPAFTYSTAIEAGFGVFEQAVRTVVGSVVGIATQQFLRGRIDRYDKYRLLGLGRTMLAVYPLVFAAAPSFWPILAVTVVGEVFVQVSMTAIAALLLELPPKGLVGSYTAVYNLLTGLAFSLGSALGGLVMEFASPCLGLPLSVDMVFLTSAVGRIVFGVLLMESFRERS